MADGEERRPLLTNANPSNTVANPPNYVPYTQPITGT